MNQGAFPVLLAAGTFLGNFIYHAARRDYQKGVIVGLMAAIIVLCIYYGVGRIAIEAEKLR